MKNKPLILASLVILGGLFFKMASKKEDGEIPSSALPSKSAGAKFVPPSALDHFAPASGSYSTDPMPEPDWKSLSQKELVEIILGEKGDGSYRVRSMALERLNADLRSPERDRLTQYLLERNKPETLRLAEWYAIKNDLLALFWKQKETKGFSETIIHLSKDISQPEILRAYALQHLPAWHESGNLAEKQRIEQVLWETSQANESSLPGVALLGLCDLCSSSSTVDPHRLGVEALRVASQGQLDVTSRISAVAVCGELKYKEAYPFILQLVQSSEPVSLRTAAMASLSQIGKRSDTAHLEPWINSKDLRLRTAAQAGITRLKQLSKS